MCVHWNDCFKNISMLLFKIKAISLLMRWRCFLFSSHAEVYNPTSMHIYVDSSELNGLKKKAQKFEMKKWWG